MLNALTVDIEEWFHLCGLPEPIDSGKWNNLESRVVQNTGKILDILFESNVKATFFILGYIAQRYPELVKKIDAGGHEIGTHGFWHNLVYQQTKEDFRKDLKQSIILLEEITGKKILGHRAASFSITRDSLWALEILSEEGIRYDCSIFPITHPRYGIVNAPRFPHKIRAGLIEFPLSTIKVLGMNLPIAGGPYFRVLPYCFIKNAISRINRIGQSVQMYIHPWELDLVQPRLNLPLNRRITHYINIKDTAKRLKRLLKDFEFGPVREVLEIG